MDSRPIGMFDSGVGGLSIFKEVKKILPEETVVFLADQANIPYSGKSKIVLKKLTFNITNYLLKFDIKLLVVACNTASCFTLDYLRESFNIPIVGVVPAVKPAGKLAKNKKIAIMCTPATAKSKYLKDLIKEHAPNAQVLKLGCEGLEQAVEDPKTKYIATLLPQYLAGIKDFGAKVIVLGCTHYIFLKDEIFKITGRNFQIIDPGKAVAERVASLLGENGIYNAGGRPKDVFLTTGDAAKFSQIASTLLKREINPRKAII